MVTGAASGIGRAVCRELARQEGLAVVGIDIRWPEEESDGIVRITADVGDPASLADAFERLDAAALGSVTKLVCAAGIQQRAPT
ncbi:MAG: hypothetical protein AVDCRST_MAG79-493, partial [uncultured Thermoleophilia bacterium]